MTVVRPVVDILVGNKVEVGRMDNCRGDRLGTNQSHQC